MNNFIQTASPEGGGYSDPPLHTPNPATASWINSSVASADERLLDAMHGMRQLTTQLSISTLDPEQKWLIRRMQTAMSQAMTAAAEVLYPLEQSSDSHPLQPINHHKSDSVLASQTVSTPLSDVSMVEEETNHDWMLNGFPPRILLAEDNPVNRELFLRVLTPLGCLVAIAADGEQAVEQAKKQPFDLILMDLQMPKMDGISATRELRRNTHTTQPKLPIVAVTANLEPDLKEACVDAGMDAFLSKPLRPQELIYTLGRFLDPARRPEGVRKEPLATLAPEDAEILRALVPLFLEESRSAIYRLQEALLHEDRKALQEISYRIKGSLVAFRECQLASLASHLEMASESVSMATLESFVDKFVLTLENAMVHWEEFAPLKRVSKLDSQE
jgi:CheY-like chemotaxis protein